MVLGFKFRHLFGKLLSLKPKKSVSHLPLKLRYLLFSPFPSFSCTGKQIPGMSAGGPTFSKNVLSFKKGLERRKMHDLYA